MSPSVERALRDRLDFSAACHMGPPSRYMGSSSLAPAIAQGNTRMDRALAQKRETPTRTTPDTRLYAYWTAEEKRRHSERMRDYYAGRKQALAKARWEKQRAAGILPGSRWAPPDGRAQAKQAGVSDARHLAALGLA